MVSDSPNDADKGVTFGSKPAVVAGDVVQFSTDQAVAELPAWNATRSTLHLHGC